MSMLQHRRRHRYIGLDVHRATIAVATADDDGSPPSTYGTIANEPSAVRKLMTRLGGPDTRLHVAYEAGPTGYVVYRQLTAMGIECLVAAPSLIPIRPGDKVKTDRRDALKLARLLRSGDLPTVWVPDQAHEALRNLVRARADAKVDELRAKHRLSKFLLRQGAQPPVGVRNWSRRYVQWLRQVEFEHLADRIVFAEYLAEVTAAGERLKRLEAGLRQCAQTTPQVALIRALQAFRGIGFLSAVTIVAEAGNVRRFRSAPQLMAYAGVVPTEHSSGGKHHRGHTTKSGNRLLRHVIGEAAHHARHAPSVGAALKRRQADLPQPMVELAWRAQLRLHARYRHLCSRLGAHKALTAVARELAGFIWAAAHLVEEVTTAAA
jgi:transposase